MFDSSPTLCISSLKYSEIANDDIHNQHQPGVDRCPSAIPLTDPFKVALGGW
jgi:hypothetical protein